MLLIAWKHVDSVTHLETRSYVKFNKEIDSKFHRLLGHSDTMCAEVASPIPQIFSCGRLLISSQNMCFRLGFVGHP